MKLHWVFPFFSDTNSAHFSAIPGILVFPFAGIVIDRVNKKWALITADFIRGITVTAMAV